MDRRIDQLFDKALKELARYCIFLDKPLGDQPFSFSDYPEVQRIIDGIFEEFRTSVEVTITKGLEWEDNLSASKATDIARVRDEPGQLQLSKRAKEFHPGAGVYRSSYKNARRLAVTETNMAYHKADNERWRQLDFVLGYEVQVSGTNPNVCPLCMELAGKYPKEFARGYIELQYHGVLTPECVESVFIPQDVLRKLNANILQLIKKSGAIVYSEDAYGNLITL